MRRCPEHGRRLAVRRSAVNHWAGYFVVAVGVFAALLGDQLAVIYAEPPYDGVRMVDLRNVLFFWGLAHVGYAMGVVPALEVYAGFLRVVNPLREVLVPVACVIRAGDLSRGYPTLDLNDRRVRIMAFEASNIRGMTGASLYEKQLLRDLETAGANEGSIADVIVGWRRPRLFEIILPLVMISYLALAVQKWGLTILIP